jgi:ABC-type glycerol-3-phosphate transport system permease component
MLIPVEATMVPLYLSLARGKILTTDFGVYLSLILPVVANAFGLYLLTQSFRVSPKTLKIRHGLMAAPILASGGGSSFRCPAPR